MAIPFFEPKQHAEPEMLGDQVDGHSGGPTPPSASAPTVSFVAVNSQNYKMESHLTVPTDSEEVPTSPPDSTAQAQAWKTLAAAMCKVLKDYYKQTSNNSQTAFTNAVVQILPNGQVQPVWK